MVESVNALNTEAEIILSDINLVGLNLKDATQKFVDAATKSGYIDLNASEENPNLVKYNVISEDKSIKLENIIHETIENYFVQNGIRGVAQKNAMEELRVSAENLNVSLGKYKIMTKVLNMTNDYSMEQLAAMSMKDVVAMLGTPIKIRRVRDTTKSIQDASA